MLKFGTASFSLVALWKLSDHAFLPSGMSDYPTYAKLHIKRAFISKDFVVKKRSLGKAVDYLYWRGYPLSSPEITQLNYQLALLYYNCTDDTDLIYDLYQALRIKPHVGEGVLEEQLRLAAAKLLREKLKL